MSAPNLKHIVQRVRDSQVWDFSTKAGLCAYSHAVVVALHAENPNFGHLKKSPGQNQCDGRAVDAALWKPTGQAYDFIGSAGFGTPPPANAVTWGTGDPEGKYGPDKWLAPIPITGTPVPTPGTPDEPDLVDLAPVLAELTLLKQLYRLLLDHSDELAKQIASINETVARLDTDMVKQPLPEYEGRNWAGRVTSRPKA